MLMQLKKQIRVIRRPKSGIAPNLRETGKKRYENFVPIF